MKCADTGTFSTRSRHPVLFRPISYKFPPPKFWEPRYLYDAANKSWTGEPSYPQNHVGRGWGIRNSAMGAVRLYAQDPSTHAQSEFAGPKQSWRQAVATLGRPHCRECFWQWQWHWACGFTLSVVTIDDSVPAATSLAQIISE